jgi:protein involved in polysaccharide export with SLBB domain
MEYLVSSIQWPVSLPREIPAEAGLFHWGGFEVSMFKRFLLSTMVSLFILSFAGMCLAQQSAPSAAPPIPPAAQQAINQGQVTPQQVQEGMKALQAGPEAVKQLQEKGGLGTLTPQEIEAGKKMLEQTTKESAKPKDEEKTPAEAKSEEKKPAKKKETPTLGEDYFPKTPSPEAPSLEIFGHKLFSSVPSTFAPITSIPVSNDYIIGPGDEVKVLMWGRLDAFYTLAVDSEGVINYPKVGPLTVAGLTFGELKELIRAKAESITGVNVNVSMGKLRTIQIFVLGEVNSPGLYTVSSLATVTNALLASGGPTALGSLRKVELKRHGKTITVIDLYAFLLRGDTSADMRLMPGDSIFIPQTGPMVAVSGNVKRPAIYEMMDDRTLQSAIDLAGGLRPRAYNQRIQIERAFQNRVQIVLDISYDELQQKKPIPLMDGDLIRVFSIHPASVNAVFLLGNVIRPGEYAFEPGLRVLNIIPDLQSLDLDTYFDYALVKRYRFEDSKSELIPFNLGRLLVSKDMSQNIVLKPKDEIYVFNKSMFEDVELAFVEGEVRKPGRYFIEDMRVRDLILKAGDLKKDAYLPRAEIIRIDKQRNRHTLYFDLAAAMASDPKHNLQVRNEDRVIIHSVWEEKWRENVVIKGEIKNPGDYPLTAGMRIRDLIFKAGQFTRDAYMDLGHLYRTDWKTKEVTILTFNVGMAMDGDPKDNVYLSDLDELVIHSVWEYKEKYTVSLKGMVNKPGDYPYADNMRIKDLILVGGNVKDAAFLHQAELVRYDIVGGNKVQTSLITFDVKLALANDPAQNLKLKPLDAITIKEIPEWKEKRTVTIAGEVLFPGAYQLRKEERLSSAIQRAGGFTDNAYLRGAVFTRESIKKAQQERLNELIRQMEIEGIHYSSAEAQAVLSKEDVAAQQGFLAAQRALIAKLKETKATGRVVISLLPASVMRDASLDTVLEDGDILYVPKSPNTVNVLGAVYNPNALLFEEQRPEVSYYLKKTGGPTDNAEADKMYIVRADGTVVAKAETGWFNTGWSDEEKRWEFGSSFADTRIYPGDTVLVPQKVVKPNFMRDVKDITTILFQIAVSAGVVIALF